MINRNYPNGALFCFGSSYEILRTDLITFAQAYLYISGDSIVINPVYLLL